MNRTSLIILLAIIDVLCSNLHAQSSQWNSVVIPGQAWKYTLPDGPNTNWTKSNFDDSSWSEGNTGIGYGDEDDETIISNTISLYMRKTFEIEDVSLVSRAVLDIDYDDGFVAYINGVEVARDLFSGDHTSYSMPSDGLHEAQLYTGNIPERYFFDKTLLSDGSNIIAVQVHNQSLTSSDLSALPVITLELPKGSDTYFSPPNWFVEPSPQPVDINFTSSNLPIVILNTGGANIPDEPKIEATMKIIKRPENELNYVIDESNPDYLDFDGPIQIEVRGSSSQLFSKKQYSLTTYDSTGEKDNVKLLGLPKENDWILNALAYDTTFVRDYVSYKLSNSLNQYASRAEYCELILNGEYRGIYMLLEKLKADDNRINIKKIKDDDNELPDLTGGYIVKADKIEGTEELGWSMPSYGWGNVNFAYEVPKPEDKTSQQDDYIQNVFNQLADTSYNPSNNSSNASLFDGYPSIIDIPSFIDFMLLNELASNVDAYQFSTFFHKDRGGKLRAGPVWDFNLTFGNDLFEWGFDRSKYNIWQFLDGNRGARFWTDLFYDPDFSCYLTKRWLELTATDQVLNENKINDLIDETVVNIFDAVNRQEQVWNIDIDFDGRIANLKTFISQRIQWITDQLNPNISACENVAIPNLVISKIHYNPQDQGDDDSDDFEFVEITNNSDLPWDLTGVYFGGLGFSYQFPPGFIVQARQSVFLANKPSAFESSYGFSPFDEFFRNLSNSSERLELLDGFGNLIDYVVYDDDSPWPEDADGNGYFLKLKDLDLDNSFAENWIASPSSQSLLTYQSNNDSALFIYPSSTREILYLSATNDIQIQSMQILNISGQTVMTKNLYKKRALLNVSSLSSGMYFISIKLNNNEIVIKKIIKE
ncbi:MAG: secretion system protein Por [Flavobacteriaceae bacterium]|nr:secretion system protein Por [Flavobacteriaceae bacterium]